MLTPVYIAEISPSRNRGTLVSLNQLAIVVGILSAYLVNWQIARLGASSWRWMLAVAAIPALVFLFGLLLIPESPRWLGKSVTHVSGTICHLCVGSLKKETSGLLGFDPSGFDDTRRAFTLAQNKTRELRLCHVHGIGPMLRKLVAQIGRSQDACDVFR